MTVTKRIVLGAECNLLIGAARQLAEQTPEISLVAVTRDFDEVPELVELHRPDIVALDGAKGVAGLANVFPLGFRDNFNRMKFVVVVPEMTDRSYLEAYAIGADAIIPAARRGREVRAVLNSLDGDTTFFNYHAVEETKLRYAQSVEGKVDKLDTCDREILRLLADGRSDKEIADTVYLANQTVRNRISRLFKLFGCRNRVELAVLIHQFKVFDESHARMPGLTTVISPWVDGYAGKIHWGDAKGA